ncbi:MAG: hypothetical protein OXU75_14580 [Deltaproteobacteria bacterium]|nr:hypothetical protein [Deltaproteobacteria bacterium]
MKESSAIDERHLPSARWDILRTLRVGGHLGATENMIRDVLVAGYIGVTRHWIRDQLDYLEARRLITIERLETAPWRMTLTRYGYDVADYQVPCDPGIRRPARPPAD